jgi:rsbT co-antagonist protein RsbR
MSEARNALQEALQQDHRPLITSWLTTQGIQPDHEAFRPSSAEARNLLESLAGALAVDRDANIQSPQWSSLRDSLESLATSRAAKGQTVGQACAFVLGLKAPLFDALKQLPVAKDVEQLVDVLLGATNDIDAMAQWVADHYQRARESIITRQQEELLELSTPVIKLWDGILAVPLIGTLDSTRTQMVMESLLQRIVETESTLAIIDITGVPTVDTLVAQHLIKTVTAIRLLGAECIISGIRPQIAQTVVHLGIDLQSVSSKSSLSGALALAFKLSGLSVERSEKDKKKKPRR